MDSRNKLLAELLREMARENRKDKFRSQAYNKAARSIASHPSPIISGSQAQKEIKGIGKSIAAKIDEIIATGKLSVLEERSEEKKGKATVTAMFEKIFGVGPVTSEKWYDKGYRTIESLANIYNYMSEPQKLGYKYYYHLLERIPRPEITQIISQIDNLWKPMNVDYVVAGSYRRGEATSGDIDILVLDKGTYTITDLVEPLTRAGILIGDLAMGENKYMGIGHLVGNDNGLARRIDIRIIKPESWAYALVYFTGSKDLNIDLRTSAIKMGLTMSEYSLTDKEGRAYPAYTEEDVFRYLNMPYLEPTQRSVQYKTGPKPIGPGLTTFVSPLEIPPAQSASAGFVAPVLAPPKEWYQPSETLYIYKSPNFTNTGHIAGFDLDWTLVRPFMGVWPRTEDDIELLPNTIFTLTKLYKDGYSIVIFTNQKSSGKKLLFNYNRVKSFIKLLPEELPIMLFMSTGSDHYRKPNPGMYQTLYQIVNNQIISGFYSGDAAGRATDFSDSDKIFAEKIGIPFYLPNNIFPPISDENNNPQMVIPQEILTIPKTLIVAMGMPGSGKTTYYIENLQPLKYLHINQDTLGTKAKVLSKVKETIKEGNNLYIDATNPKLEDRTLYYNLGVEHGYNLVTLYFVRDGRGYNKLRPSPVPDIAYSMYFKNLIEPTANNTPGKLFFIR